MSGVLNLVSVGPGESDLIVPRAREALKNSDVIVGYELYLRWIMPWLEGKEIYTPPLTQERERARLAIEKARAGARVALISSGDIGVYAMAALAFEEMREDDTFALSSGVSRNHRGQCLRIAVRLAAVTRFCHVESVESDVSVGVDTAAGATYRDGRSGLRVVQRAK